MNILIFAPTLPQTERASLASNLVAFLTSSGQQAHLVATDIDTETGTAQYPSWKDEAAVHALVNQADMVVYQLGGDPTLDAGALSWLTRLPGVLWLCEGCTPEIARRHGPHALGLLAPAGSDLDALLPCCPGPVYAVPPGGAGEALLRMGPVVQRSLPVCEAVDAMSAILRGWGADEGTIAAAGLAGGFDLFQA